MNTEETQAESIRVSDIAIRNALAVLQSSPRGRSVLTLFAAMANSPDSQGLDLSGGKALVALTKEFVSGRRTFLGGITSEHNAFPKGRWTT